LAEILEAQSAALAEDAGSVSDCAREPMSERLPRTLEYLSKLVAFDTTSARGNVEIADFLSELLEDHGATVRRFLNPAGDKVNLWATIGSPDSNGGLVLSAHTDCVPAEASQWTTDPFRLTERDGRLYGRGTTDMKGFIASALSCLPELVPLSRTRPIHLSLSYDEEIGCSGVPIMLQKLARMGFQPDWCVVGEPTQFHAVVGHKGGTAYRCHVSGNEAHSSLAPRAVNAIQAAAELVSFMSSLAEELKTSKLDHDYDIPHSTISVGQIFGGKAINVVPMACDFSFEFRNIFSVDQSEIMERIEHFAQGVLLPRMRAIYPAADISFEQIHAYPAHEIDVHHPAVRAVQQAAGSSGTRKVAFGTEAGVFQRDLGVPTVVCGPGSIEQAHTPNEFIHSDQLASCNAFILRMCEAASRIGSDV
jgi:acetylornithine deacetylase